MSSSLLSPVSPQLEKARTSTTIKTSCFSYLTPTRSPLARSRTRSTCPSPSPTSINSTHSSDISRLASSPSASTTSSSDDSWTPPSLPPGFLDLVKLASTTSPDSSFEVSAAGDEEEETSMAFPPEQKMPAQRSGALKEEGQRKPTKSGDDGPRTVQRMDSLVKLRKSRSRTFEGKLDGLDELAMLPPLPLRVPLPPSPSLSVPSEYFPSSPRSFKSSSQRAPRPSPLARPSPSSTPTIEAPTTPTRPSRSPSRPNVWLPSPTPISHDFSGSTLTIPPSTPKHRRSRAASLAPSVVGSPSSFRTALEDAAWDRSVSITPQPIRQASQNFPGASFPSPTGFSFFASQAVATVAATSNYSTQTFHTTQTSASSELSAPPFLHTSSTTPTAKALLSPHILSATQQHNTYFLPPTARRPSEAELSSYAEKGKERAQEMKRLELEQKKEKRGLALRGEKSASQLREGKEEKAREGETLESDVKMDRRRSRTLSGMRFMGSGWFGGGSGGKSPKVEQGGAWSAITPSTPTNRTRIHSNSTTPVPTSCTPFFGNSSPSSATRAEHLGFHPSRSFRAHSHPSEILRSSPSQHHRHPTSPDEIYRAELLIQAVNFSFAMSSSGSSASSLGCFLPTPPPPHDHLTSPSSTLSKQRTSSSSGKARRKIDNEDISAPLPLTPSFATPSRELKKMISIQLLPSSQSAEPGYIPPPRSPTSPILPLSPPYPPFFACSSKRPSASSTPTATSPSSELPYLSSHAPGTFDPSGLYDSGSYLSASLTFSSTAEGDGWRERPEGEQDAEIGMTTGETMSSISQYSDDQLDDGGEENVTARHLAEEKEKAERTAEDQVERGTLGQVKHRGFGSLVEERSEGSRAGSFDDDGMHSFRSPSALSQPASLAPTSQTRPSPRRPLPLNLSTTMISAPSPLLLPCNAQITPTNLMFSHQHHVMSTPPARRSFLSDLPSHAFDASPSSLAGSYGPSLHPSPSYEASSAAGQTFGSGSAISEIEVPSSIVEGNHHNLSLPPPSPRSPYLHRNKSSPDTKSFFPSRPRNPSTHSSPHLQNPSRNPASSSLESHTDPSPPTAAFMSLDPSLPITNTPLPPPSPTLPRSVSASFKRAFSRSPKPSVHPTPTLSRSPTLASLAAGSSSSTHPYHLNIIPASLFDRPPPPPAPPLLSPSLASSKRGRRRTIEEWRDESADQVDSGLVQLEGKMAFHVEMERERLRLIVEGLKKKRNQQ